MKNVFIAVITETFNEIRVQFQQMWGTTRSGGRIAEESNTKILTGDEFGWKLVQIDGNRKKGLAPIIFSVVLQSAAFR